MTTQGVSRAGGLLRFAPVKIHVHTGTVRITLQDSGAYPHNIVIPALGVTSASVTGVPAARGCRSR